MYLDQFSTTGDDADKTATVVEEKVKFLSVDTSSELQIVSGKFDQKAGDLILIRNNGEQVIVNGFLTLDSMGQGKKGKKGAKGDPGLPGSDGIDGEDGDCGCAGTKGEKGDKGPTGPAGEDGPRGQVGPRGIIGEKGDLGPTGDKGPTGREGPRGDKGVSCNAGPTGPRGPAPFDRAVVSATEPSSNVFVWFFPTDDPNAALPVVPNITADITDVTVVGRKSGALTATSSLYVADLYVPVQIKGGSGSYSFAWTGENLESVTYTRTDARSLHVTINQSVGAGQSMQYSIGLKCVIKDTLYPTRTPVTVTGTLTFIARNLGNAG